MNTRHLTPEMLQDAFDEIERRDAVALEHERFIRCLDCPAIFEGPRAVTEHGWHRVTWHPISYPAFGRLP